MTLTYAVRPWLAGLLGAATVTAGVVAARTPFPGRFLFLVVTAAAGAETLRAVLFRPTLRANSHGIEVVVGLHRERHPWRNIDAVTTIQTPSSATTTMRRRADALEIDVGERLVVVPAYRLGTSAAEAAESLRTLSSMTASGP